MGFVRLRTVRSLVIFGCAVTAVACASAAGGVPGAIAAADRDAKRAVSEEALIDPAKIPARSLGVLPFSVAANDTLLQPLGYAMAEFMTNDLSRSSDLVVVDRLRTDAILRELDLVDKGIVDPRTAPRVGRLVGARRLLVGDVSLAPDGSVQFNARVVDVIAGTVQPLVAARAPLDRAIDAEKELALRVFEGLNVTLTPSQRVAVERRQTTNLAATVAYGRGLDAEAHGDAAAAAQAFEEAARRDASFVAARTMANAAQGRSATRPASGLQRVLELSNEGINPAVTTKLPEAVDAPLHGPLLTLVINVRVF